MVYQLIEGVSEFQNSDEWGKAINLLIELKSKHEMGNFRRQTFYRLIKTASKGEMSDTFGKTVHRSIETI